MPSTQLTDPEEALVNHVRAMVSEAVRSIVDKVPDLAEVHDNGHAIGMTAGRVESLQWVTTVLRDMGASLGPYDDIRTVDNLQKMVADKLREVQAG